MKIPRMVLLLAAPILCGQSHEIGLSIGALSPNHFSLESKTTQALQANYGYALTSGKNVRLLAEVNLNAAPLVEVQARDSRAAQDVAALFLIPGLRLQLGPERRLAPYVAAGFGYAQFHASELVQGGGANPLRDRQHTYAGNFAAGADLRIARWLALRGEVRQFVGPGPELSPVRAGGTQGSTTFTGGFVLRLGR